MGYRCRAIQKWMQLEFVDDDYVPLSRIFNESMMRTLRKEFCGISMPSDSDMDAVRMMLNMNYGGDFKLSGDM